jgi:hypothetical protein
MATMVVSDEEGNGDGGKSDGDGDEGGRRTLATRAKAAAMRAMAKGDEDDEGGGRLRG